jgi:hypothetical protein
MREAIRHLWSNPREASRIGANARRLVIEKYSSAGFGERLAEVVRARLSNQSHSH